MQPNVEHLWSGQTPASGKIHTLFELSAKRYPNYTALVFQNESLTFKELNDKADTLCHAILNWAYYDDVIGISTTPGPEMVIGVLAILKSGKAFLPIDLKASRQKNLQIIADANLNFCLAKTSEYIRFSEMNLKVIESDTERQYPIIHQKRLGNLAYLMYTSGSTCSSKGVRIEHSTLIHYLMNAISLYSTNNNSGSFLQLPLSFDASLTSLFTPLLCGKQLVLAETNGASAFNDPNFVKHMPYDFIKLTPLQFNWLEKALNGRTLSFARHIVVGGENLHVRHFSFLLNKGLETDIINEYGPTEATVGCMTYSLPLNRAFEDTPSGVPIGKAMPGNEILILNNKMEAVGPGEIGEIYIGGKQLSAGYLMRPELNLQVFIPHPYKQGEKVFRTGDFATINNEGTAIYLDRIENHLETEGQRIDFNTIEWAISHISGIKHCEVVTKTIDNNKRLLAYIMPDGQGIDIESLPLQLSQKIPANWMPQKFIVISEWPHTLHGKLNKHALPIPLCNRHVNGKKRLAETPLQKELANVWCSLLNIQQTDIDTGFFEMGGNHLLADQMIQTLDKLYQYKINLAMLYKCSSISCLASEIEKHQQLNTTAKKIFRFTESGYSA